MSPTPTGREPADELDAEYRRLASHDTSVPSESVRQAVHAYAARLARERREQQAESVGGARVRERRVAWRGALFGTLAAAAIAGIMVAPRLLSLRAPPAASAAGSLPAPPTSEARRALVASDEAVHAEPPPAPSPQLAKAAPSHVRPATPPAREPTGLGDHTVAEGLAADASAKAEERSRQSVQETVVTGARAPTPAAGRPADSTAADSAAAAPGANRARAQSESLAGVRPEETDSPSSLGSGLLGAARQGDVTSARGFLADGADVNARDGTGRTPLLVTVLAGHADMVDLLLQSGADPNLADAHGLTPLRAAEAGGNTSLAATLRAHGAK
jgi:hypothetical protein